MGKSSINGPFSTAMLNNQRVKEIYRRPFHVCGHKAAIRRLSDGYPLLQKPPHLSRSLQVPLPAMAMMPKGEDIPPEVWFTMWGPRSIAKLVYNSNNYGLWYL